jgi:hypothetical protein
LAAVAAPTFPELPELPFFLLPAVAPATPD